MKRIMFFCSLFFLFAGHAHALSTPAKPTSVLLFPNEALLKVEESLPVTTLADGSVGVRIHIPAQANAQSFFVMISGKNAESFFWEEVTPYRNFELSEETDPVRHELLGKYLQAKTALHDVDARMTTMAKQRMFLDALLKMPESQEAQTAENIKQLYAFYGTSTQDIEVSLQEIKLEKLSKQNQFEKTEKTLHEFDLGNSVVTACIPLEKWANTVKVSYSYMVPVYLQLQYNINAMPADKKLSVQQSLQVSQGTGVDWTNANMSVALIQRSYSPVPLSLEPWQLDYKNAQKSFELMAKSAPAPQNRMAESIELSALDLSTSAGFVSQNNLPIQVEMATYRLWDLGKRTIKSNIANSFSLATDTYDAEYFYTLRPTTGKYGYLSARVAFPSAIELPMATANTFVENAYAGTQQLNVQGVEHVFYFGIDPQITIDKRELTAQRGERGLFSKEQTRDWEWELTVTNMRSKTVSVVVEDPQPVSRDKSINIKVESNPKAESVFPLGEDSLLKLFVWKKEIEAGKTFTIKHNITVGGAADKSLSSTR